MGLGLGSGSPLTPTLTLTLTLSRCVRLGMHPQTGELRGGLVQTYLLEKSRVISFSEQERNFHPTLPLTRTLTPILSLP